MGGGPTCIKGQSGGFPPKQRWTGIGAGKRLIMPDLLQRNVKALGSLLLLVYCLVEDHHLRILKREGGSEGCPLRLNLTRVVHLIISCCCRSFS